MTKQKFRKNENIMMKLLRVILIILLFPFVLFYIVKIKINKAKQHKINDERVAIYDISQLNSLSGVEFEMYLKILFEKMGYNVQMTKKSKDFGADLILEKNGQKNIVQAKRFSHTVGISAVQEIISARAHYNVHGAIVVSNQNFSKEAQILATENDVLLAGKTELQSLIKKYPVYFEQEQKKYVATCIESVQAIEMKYKSWI